MKKKIVVLLVLLLLPIALGNSFSLRVNTEKELYRGMFWTYHLGDIEIANGCMLSPVSEKYTTTIFKVTDYGVYEIEIHIHHYLDNNFATWKKFTIEGKTAFLNMDLLEGIQVFDIYLRENGEIVDKIHRSWNFQNGTRLRFF